MSTTMRGRSSNLEGLEKKLKIDFTDKNLLKNAFIHRSYLNEHKNFKASSNERLEFLGDSILSLVVSQFLYEKLPASPEGELTTLRAALVRTETLAKIAKELDLGFWLLMSKGEEESGGRQNPSILANTFEALVGAIYLDKDLKTVSSFLEHTILKRWKELKKTAVADNKSKLQELLQRRYHKSPSYKLLSTWGPDHAREFEMGVYLDDKFLGRGAGKNKQAAAQKAAGDALTRLKSQTLG